MSEGEGNRRCGQRGKQGRQVIRPGKSYRAWFLIQRIILIFFLSLFIYLVISTSKLITWDQESHALPTELARHPSLSFHEDLARHVEESGLVFNQEKVTEASLASVTFHELEEKTHQQLETS